MKEPLIKHNNELDELWAEIETRMGVCPSFFRLASADPSIARGLFDLAKFAYLESPLPAEFKEKLFTYLSRFCPVRYCITRHAAFLLGKGYVAGDPNAPLLTAEEVAKLVNEPLPKTNLMPKLRAELESHPPVEDWPDYDSHLGLLVRTACTMIFVEPERSFAWNRALKNLFGAQRYEQLMLYLAFIRTAHFWTEVHPELELEEDINRLLSEHEALASTLLNYQGEKSALLNEKFKFELGELKSLSLLTNDLRLSNERFRAAVDAVKGVLWTNNAIGEMEGEQPGWAALTGQTYEEYRGFGWSDAVHPDDTQPTIDAWKKAVAEKKPFIFEHRVKRHDQEWRHFSIRAIPVFYGDEIGEWVGVHTDITDQKNAERQLIEQSAQLEAVYQAMNDGVLVFNMQGEAVLVNEAAARIVGLSSAKELKQDFEFFEKNYDLHELNGAHIPIDNWPLLRVMRRITDEYGSAAQ